jgi:hypothetical protein
MASLEENFLIQIDVTPLDYEHFEGYLGEENHAKLSKSSRHERTRIDDVFVYLQSNLRNSLESNAKF